MMIECRELTKTYLVEKKPVFAVDNVNLSISRGEFVVILGHSGSGKTTLLSLIGGLTTPDRGQVLVDGEENWQQSDNDLSTMRNSRIGFIFQFASLIPTLTVMENILLPMTFSLNPAGNRAMAREILAEVGLADRENSFPSQLSGGQQRRVAIARSFINQPDIILADEPTGDLDEETERDILDLFSRYNAKGTTFVVVTHNSNLAATQKGARVFSMSQGVLSAQAA
ncbi:MAG: ABC transporter ATP-binding protein [Desulfoarculaceae bacterium]|nr:ABC transporter ATP-binding protein [Desulfoarculaceae bacterium]